MSKLDKTKTVLEIKEFEPFVEYCESHLETLSNDLFKRKNRKQVLCQMMELRFLTVGNQWTFKLPNFITKYDVESKSDKYVLWEKCLNRYKDETR
jgi:hypothetical protein